MAENQGPPQIPENPFVPPGPAPLLFEDFEGINTATTRVGVADKQMWLSDGWMPLGPRRNLRVLPGVGSSIYTSDDGVSFFDFGNIGADPIMVVFLNDGAIDQVNTDTGTVTPMGPAGTIVSASRNDVGMTQWGSEFIIIAANQTDGYFIWDGTSLFTAGSIAPQVLVTAGGSGYSASPVVAASGGSGTGATFVATVSGGVIISIAVTNPGAGYSVGDTVTIGITDGTGTGATATLLLMPFGIRGTMVETYAGRVWVGDGPSLAFSAPGSYQDFATSSGGGSFSSSDSFLRVGFTQLRQTNGFLYLIADSSVNYISGVQTSGSPPTTTFTNQNADPEVGTPYPASVTSFGRNILFANAFGAHVTYGAAVTKISEALDGIYNTVPSFGGFGLSAAKAIIFAKKVWMLLVPIIDPITGQQVNKLMMWNGKLWWTSGQDVGLTYIQHQEINSVLTAYGTDGSSVYPLFQSPSVLFRKTVQSRLWDAPGGYQLFKSAVRLWGLLQYNVPDTTPVTISIDNESGSADTDAVFTAPTMIWTTAADVVMVWTTSLGDPMLWVVSGYSVMPPVAVGQVGVLTGLTVTTFAADVSLISLMLQDEIVGYRG